MANLGCWQTDKREVAGFLEDALATPEGCFTIDAVLSERSRFVGDDNDTGLGPTQK